MYIKRDTIWAIFIGTGIALSPIHNQWITNLVTKEGEVGFFLPAFGTAIWLIGALCFVVDNWGKIDWGEKKLYIPLAVIVVAIALSGIPQDRIIDKIAPLFMGISLFALYLAGRKLGRNIFKPLAIGAGLGIIGVFISGFFIWHGEITGGVLFEYNYDIVVGYVLLGVALFKHRYQWLFALVALLAMFVSGSPEGLFAIGLLVVAVLYRRDWGRRLLYVAGSVFVIAVIYFSLGYGQNLYGYAVKIVRNEPMPNLAVPGETVVGYRLMRINQALDNLQPLGDGYNLTAYTIDTVHNVPLVIVQQLGYGGIIAGIAWLWLSFYCLFKTRWKYVWVLILALSVFDHFIFTQLAPVWWAVIGVTTAGGIKNDLIFRSDTNLSGKVRARW